MEININRMPNFGASEGIQGPKGGMPEKAGRPSGLGADPLTVTLGATAPSEGLVEVPESALRRDDDLGRFIDPYFRQPAPPMPAFE